MKTLLALLMLCAVAQADEITITFTVPNGTKAAYIDKVAAAFGYKDTITDNEQTGGVVAPVEKPNPESAEAFCKRTLLELFISKVKEAAVAQAVAEASADARAEAEATSKASAEKVGVR